MIEFFIILVQLDEFNKENYQKNFRDSTKDLIQIACLSGTLTITLE